jgi:hypothetical protein
VLNITLILEGDEQDKLRARAKSLGVSVSAYVRQVVRDSLKRDPEAKDAKLLRGMRAVIPVLAEGFGRDQKLPREEIEALAKTLLERYDREI